MHLASTLDVDVAGNNDQNNGTVSKMPAGAAGKDYLDVAGLVLFFVRISPSFAFFTIKKRDDNELLDVIVRTADGIGTMHLAAIIEEVERCQNSSELIRVYGQMPFEQNYYGSEGKCLRALNVNEVPIPELVCRTIPWMPVQQQTRLAAASNEDGRRKRPNIKKYARAGRFVEWLVDEFGHRDCLDRSSVGVLDVAGGAGAVAFELSAMRSIPCTVIDPRPIKLNSRQKRTLRFRQERLCSLLPGSKISPLAFAMAKRYQDWQPSQQQQCLFNHEFSQSEVGLKLLHDCTCIVGMHPDEATDAIMDLAIQYKKPFALVPCCVFPKLFSHRRLANGKYVQSYEDLCEYIMNRTHNVQQASLDFEGRNKVFYWIPPEE